MLVRLCLGACSAEAERKVFWGLTIVLMSGQLQGMHALSLAMDLLNVIHMDRIYLVAFVAYANWYTIHQHILDSFGGAA